VYTLSGKSILMYPLGRAIGFELQAISAVSANKEMILFIN